MVPCAILNMCVNDFWTYILAILCGDWLQIVLNEVLATIIDKGGSDMLHAPF